MVECRVRFLGIGESNDLGAMYMSLLAEGHECRVAVSDAAAADTLQGFVPRTADWRAELEWIRAAATGSS